MPCSAEKMTWNELKQKAAEGEVAILPFGTTERHGQHLPMETDAAIATEVALKTGTKSGAVVFPTIPFGIVETTAFAGVFLSEETYLRLVREVTLAIEAIGFSKILFLSGHHENNFLIFSVMKELFAQKPKGRIYCLCHCMSLVGELLPEIILNRQIGHADFRETSLMLAINPTSVKMDDGHQISKISSPLTENVKSIGIHKIQFDKGTALFCHQNDDVLLNGGYGQLVESSKETGGIILETLSNHLAGLIAEMKHFQ